MNRDQLKKGQELVEKIDICEKALNEMRDTGFTHGKFYLHITEHSDGSGFKVDLCGIDVISVKYMIKEEIERQLKNYKAEFEEI